MERRDFLRNIAFLSAAAQFPACVFSDKKNVDFGLKTFEKELSLKGMQDFWAMLMSGYKNALTPEQSWGVINPDYKQWIRTPNNIKGDPELVARTMFGLGAWFSKKNRSEKISFRGEEINLKELFENALKNGTNPKSSGYWNGDFTGNNPGANQLAVEAPAVALAYYLTKKNNKIDFSDKEKEQINNWFQIYSKNTRSSNWCLSYALTATICKKEGGYYDADLLNVNLDTGFGCYEKDGWFSDGKGERRFDDYNNWVFATFFMYWKMIDGDSYPELSNKIPGIMRDLTNNQKYFYGGDGSHPEYGRSLTYKFTRLSSLIMAYKMGYSNLPVGLIKRIVRLHLLYYVKNGAIDNKSGIVLQSLTKDGSLDIREVYNYAGSTYWVMQTLGALWMLDDNDPFWTVKEELLPVEKADFAEHFEVPGWLMVGTKDTESTILYNAGVDHALGWADPSYYSKYRKNAYHSQLGFLVGNFKFVPCDNMPVLVHNNKSFYPVIESFDIAESVLRINQTYIKKEIPGKVSISTILLVDGEDLIRLCYITRDNKMNSASIRIGGYALGINSKDRLVISEDDNYKSAVADNYQTILSGLHSEKWSLKADDYGYMGDTSKHTKCKSFYFPYFEKVLEKDSSLLAIACRGSNKAVDVKQWNNEIKILKLNKSEISVEWRKKMYNVKFLK